MAAWAIGGHNIEKTPLRVRLSPEGTMPRMEGSPGKATLVIPQNKLDRINTLALDVERGKALGAEKAPLDVPSDQAPLVVQRELTTVLNLDSSRTGTLLEEMRRTSPHTFDSAEVVSRANECACDIDVIKDKGEAITVIKTSPPPSAHTVIGSSGVIELLTKSVPRNTIRFEGFAPHDAAGIGRSLEIAAERKMRTPPRSRIERWIDTAQTIFGTKPTESGGFLLDVVTAHGTRTQLHIFARSHVDHLALVVKPDWKKVKLSEVSYEPPNWFLGTEYPMIDPSLKAAHIELRFQNPQVSGRTDSWGMMASFPVERISKAAKRLRTNIAASLPGMAKRNESVKDGIAALHVQILKDLKPNEIYFFHQSNLGDVQQTKLTPQEHHSDFFR
jgi:hypothetical protein